MRVRVWWVAAFVAAVWASFTAPGFWLLAAFLLVGVFGVHVRQLDEIPLVNLDLADRYLELWSRDAS